MSREAMAIPATENLLPTGRPLWRRKQFQRMACVVAASAVATTPATLTSTSAAFACHAQRGIVRTGAVPRVQLWKECLHWARPAHQVWRRESISKIACRVASALGVTEVYSAAMCGSLALAVGLGIVAKPWAGGATDAASPSQELASTFLPVWLLCIAGDWLQGPYVYALYESYGLPREDIARLFVAGFGASMAFGTFVGSWVDQIGRKRGCQLYCFLYICSCLTKHFGNFWVLLVGRLTGGVATSLLFSAFEAWLVREHELREIGPASADPTSMSAKASAQARLRRIFGLMWFGSSLVAIVAGPSGDAVINLVPSTEGTWAFYYGGLASAFDLAIVMLLAGLALLTATWQEHDGGQNVNSSPDKVTGVGGNPVEMLQLAARVLAKEPTLLALMAIVTGFEGALYGFIFNWTPALTDGATTPPALGTVFATLMLAYTSGSLAFQVWGSESNDSSESNNSNSQTGLLKHSIFPLRAALAVSPVALLTSAAGLTALPASSPVRTAVVLGGFLVFEFCCGVYAPAVSSVKGVLVPEQMRSTIYSIYRAPMNAVVLVVLLWGAPPASCFVACACLLGLAGIASVALPDPDADGIAQGSS